MKNQGFNLIEVLIALFLCSILSTAMIQCFLLSKQIFMEQNAYIRITENKAYLQEKLSQIIHMSGSFPCSSFTRNQMVTHSPELELGKILGKQSLEVFKVENDQSLSNLSLRMQSNSPVLWIKYTKEIFPAASMNAIADGTLTLQGSAHWKRGDVILISDCTRLGVFSLMEDAHVTHNKTQLKIKSKQIEDDLLAFQHHVRVGKLLSIYYFIADSKRKTQGGDIIWSLYEKVNQLPATELLEGIDGWEINTTRLFPSYKTQVKAKVWFNSVEPARAYARLLQHFHKKMPTRNVLDTQTYVWNSKI